MAEFESEPDALGNWLLRRELVTAMRVYAAKIKALKYGFEPDDQFYYSPNAVERFLPAVLKGDKEPPKSHDSVGSTGKDPAEGGDYLVSWLDIERAWLECGLTPTQTAIILDIYYHGLTQSAIADAMGKDQSTISRSVTASLKRMSDFLGGSRLKGCPYDCECHEGKLRRRPGSHGADDAWSQLLS
jgi:DNA-directed RNA polymerase specialized sigma24 family protein